MELIKLREKFEKDLMEVPNNETKHFYYKLLNSHQNANSTILPSTQESVVSYIDSNQNMLKAAFFDRLPKDEACTDYKDGSVNKLYIIAPIFLVGEKTGQK